MIKKLSMLMLMLGLSIPGYGSDQEYDTQPKEKKARVCLSEQVEKLDLSFNPDLTNVEFILVFPNLINLSLYNCCNLRDNYKPISQLTNLLILNLFEINLTNTEYLKPLVNLKELKISCLDLEKCIDPLASLSLKKLEIKGYNYPGLLKLSQLTSLESLVLSNFHKVEEDFEGKELLSEEFPPLDFIAPLINLRELDLTWNEYITHIKPIVNLPKLEDLNLSICGIEDLKSVSDLKNIKYLTIKHASFKDIKSEKDILFLLNIESLIKLTISRDTPYPSANNYNSSRKIFYED